VAKAKFPREVLLDILEGTRHDAVVLDEINGHSRWSIQYRLVFRLDERLWETFYSVGATEEQDLTPWQYEDMVECLEVTPVERRVTMYEPAEEVLGG
jgi:hypothetical protein